MPDPVTTPTAADVLGLDDAETINWQVANAIKYPVDPAGIRAEMARLLSKPRCAAFVKELIERTAENAAPGNTVVENGDVLKIFDRILEFKNKKGRGVVRSGGPGAIPGANFAFGDFKGESATIQLGVVQIFANMTVGEWKQRYRESDGRFGLHETMHHAGMMRYTDEEYAIAVNAMVPNAPALPPPGSAATAFSWYWDDFLRASFR